MKDPVEQIMENNKYREFKVLVERCAGPDRKEQEKYLARVVVKLMKMNHGREADFSEVLQTPEKADAKKASAAIMSSRDANSFVAKMLLNDIAYDFMGIRSKATDFMQSDLERRQKIQRAAGCLNEAHKGCIL